MILVPIYGADGAGLAATIAFTAGGVVQVIAHWQYEPFPLRELLPGVADVRDTFIAGRRVVRRRYLGEAGAPRSTPAPEAVGSGAVDVRVRDLRRPGVELVRCYPPNVFVPTFL